MDSTERGPCSIAYKCRKCRKDLNVTKTLDANQTLVLLHQEYLPDWISSKVEECSWTKTKLHCPSCGFHVGAADFISGSLNPIHLIKSRVDVLKTNLTRETSDQTVSPLE